MLCRSLVLVVPEDKIKDVEKTLPCCRIARYRMSMGAYHMFTKGAQVPVWLRKGLIERIPLEGGPVRKQVGVHRRSVAIPYCMANLLNAQLQSLPL